jgi:hypothetical protein
MDFGNPAARPSRLLGDVVISAETAHRQAEAAGGKGNEEILFLMIHGILHLLGYDHEKSAEERRKMEAKERELFSLVYSSELRVRSSEKLVQSLNPHFAIEGAMSFKNILGHQRPITLLQRAIKNEKVVNSYLFLGNEGIGKKLVALEFAKALNCLGKESGAGDACDHCSSCKKIDHALHPDILVIEPDGQYIKVDQVIIGSSVNSSFRDLSHGEWLGPA